MEISDLHDLEFAIFADSRDRLSDGLWRTTANTQTGFRDFWGDANHDCLVFDFPARTRFDSIGAEQNINRRDGLLRIRGMARQGAAKPDPSWARLPAFSALIFFGNNGVESPDAEVENNFVSIK